MNTIFVTADDIGLSEGINESIFDTVDHGCVTRVSILANGESVDGAIAGAVARPALELALHANLTEGPCVAPKESLTLLVDGRGMFIHSVLGLLLADLFSAPAVRATLHAQIQTELTAQLARLRQTGARVAISNGHQHVHMLPFVFSVLMVLPGIEEIRIPREPFYIASEHILALLHPRVFGFYLAQLLAAHNRRSLKKTKIRANDWFIEILYAGSISLATVTAGLRAARQRDATGSIEVLLHPGCAKQDELSLWRTSRANIRWHYAHERQHEAALAKSPELKETLKTYGG